MRPLALLFACVIALLMPGPMVRAASSSGVEAPTVPAELTAKPLLYEIVRYLYRWHIDEADLDRVVQSNEVVFWAREIKVALDEKDNSRFAAVTLPQFRLEVRLKKADYVIPERDVRVVNEQYRIVSVATIDPGALPEDAVEIKHVYTDLRDELFRTRNQARFPEGELLERLRAAARRELEKEGVQRPADAGANVIHLAPLSSVANEAWVYWESGRRLLRFDSDIDLADARVWEHENLSVRVFDIDTKVVVSLDEVSGSNAFMTRDQAGRILFNCMVLGRRLELQPAKP
jgi:hypothetical protein